MADPALRRKVEGNDLVVAPCAFDMMTLVIAEQFNFDALFFSGYWGMASHLGVPDAGIATFRDFVTQIEKFADYAKTPIIADADTGFGGVLNLQHTVRGYERAGASAIQLEDQVSPKKCGHVGFKEVCSVDEMTTRVKIAVDERRSDDFLVIARTDAIASEGLEAAIARGRAYREAGADIVFVEAPQSEDDMRRICAEGLGPQLANMAHGGKTPILSAEALQQIGYAIAIVPAAAPLAALKAAENAFASIKAGRLDVAQDLDIFDFKRFCDLIGFPDVFAFEAKWGREAYARDAASGADETASKETADV